jgi:lysophospholipase L1-like esterase
LTEKDCKLGVLAFGDSITNGGGELQWGVALQSWAQWLARALGLPFTNYAADGARVDDVVDRQMPAFERRTARPDARYDLGCLFVGVNDVRDPDFDPRAFEARFHDAVAFLGQHCDRTLTLTAPLALGVPRTPEARVRALNDAIARAGALVVDLSDVRARNHVMADRVHPTAFGQIAIAERALQVLGDAPRVRPSSLIEYETTRWKRLRGDATYVYRYLKAALPPR